MMSGFFLQVLDRSETAEFVVLTVVLARLLLSRRPKALACALWAVVLLRLLCPAFPQAPFSLVPEMPVHLPLKLAEPLGWVWLTGTAAMLVYGFATSLILRKKLRGAEPLAEDARADYSEFLLSMASGRGPFGGLTLRFGGGETAKRIKYMKKRQKQPLWLIVTASFLCLALAGCLLTDQQSREQELSLDFLREMYSRRVLRSDVCVAPDGECRVYNDV